MIEFSPTHFANPSKCHDFLVEMRWPTGVECPHCGSQKVGIFSGKRLVSNCKNCKKQFTAKVGTPFENSALSLETWLAALWLFLKSDGKISTVEMARFLRTPQLTGYRIKRRIVDKFDLIPSLLKEKLFAQEFGEWLKG